MPTANDTVTGCHQGFVGTVSYGRVGSGNVDAAQFCIGGQHVHLQVFSKMAIFMIST
jgi:hypothetical protein